jgi:Putative Actinobacterial Holin-X, holin superfamily III
MAEQRAERSSQQRDQPRDHERAEERTVGQLVAQASQQVSEIIRAELALAKAELATSARNGAVAGGMFGAAGYLGFLASILLTIAAAYGLTEAGLRPWLAFLLVAVAFLILAGVLALIGRSRIGRIGPPTRAIESTRLTLAAVKPGHHAPAHHTPADRPAPDRPAPDRAER